MVRSSYSKETKIEVKRELFRTKRAFSNADFQQGFKGRYAVCMTMPDTSRSSDVPLESGWFWKGQCPCNSWEIVWGFPWTSDLRDLRHHYLICSRLGETSMHVSTLLIEAYLQTYRLDLSSGRISHVCCTPFEASLHKSRHSFGSMHLQVNAKFAFTGPLHSAGLRQRRFPSTWWLVTVRKLQAMSMMLYKY